MNPMDVCGIEQTETGWATWTREVRRVHQGLWPALEEVAVHTRRGDGHAVVVSASPTVLDLASQIRIACRAEVCAPFDDITRARSRTLSNMGHRSEALIATDASRRSGRRAAVCVAAYDGAAVHVSVQRLADMRVHAAETLGILIGAQLSFRGSGCTERKIVCDSQHAVSQVNALRGACDRDVARFSERTFGSWSYSITGRRAFERARATARDLADGRVQIEWVRGHDDRAESLEHDLNVIADQVARSASYPREFGHAERAQTARTAEAIVQTRLPGTALVLSGALSAEDALSSAS